MKLLLLILLPVLSASAQPGTRDRYFTRYPFTQWQADGDRSQIRWRARVQPPHLSAHQRLVARVEVEVESKEIAKRRGRGSLVTFVQIEDTGGRVWRTHNSYGLAGIPPDVKAVAVLYTQDVFIVPGDYIVSLAICDSQTREYSFARRTLHVAGFRNDPLPAAWSGLPAVELVEPFGTPDFWFQPYLRGKLNLPVTTSRPVHIDLIMNMTPSVRLSGSVHSFRRNMSVLVPALKILSGIELSQGSIDVTLLDLTLRKTWEQKNARGLDWNRMRAPFANSNPGVIDAQSLGAKAEMAQFFWDRILDRIRGEEGDDKSRVMIVLSAPAFLEHQVKVEPATVPRDPNRKVFYLRYRPVPPPRPQFAPFGQGVLPAATAMPWDDLEHTLKPLDARVYSAITPEEFRKIVSNVIAQLENM